MCLKLYLYSFIFLKIVFIVFLIYIDRLKFDNYFWLGLFVCNKVLYFDLNVKWIKSMLCFYSIFNKIILIIFFIYVNYLNNCYNYNIWFYDIYVVFVLML